MESNLAYYKVIGAISMKQDENLCQGVAASVIEMNNISQLSNVEKSVYRLRLTHVYSTQLSMLNKYWKFFLRFGSLSLNNYLFSYLTYSTLKSKVTTWLFCKLCPIFIKYLFAECFLSHQNASWNNTVASLNHQILGNFPSHLFIPNLFVWDVTQSRPSSSQFKVHLTTFLRKHLIWLKICDMLKVRIKLSKIFFALDSPVAFFPSPV